MPRLLLVLVVAVGACGPRAAKPANPSQSKHNAPATAAAETGEPAVEPVTQPVLRLEPVTIEVVPDERGESHVVAYDARDLLDAGNEAMAEGDYDRALAHYDQLLADFPESRLVVLALFNAGLAHEGRQEVDRAIARYRALVARGEPGRDSTDAHIRMGALLAEHERWSEATQVFESLLARNDLTPTDRIEGLARLGYVLLSSKDYAGAEEVLRSALGYFQSIRDEVLLDTDYYVAMAQYYLAQIPHRQFEAIPIRIPDKQTERDMNAKAELVILAHDRYVKTVEVGNPYWSTAAGYQLAHMRKQFWDSLVIAPIPPHLPPEAAEYYVKRVHEETRLFLEQALETHTKNVQHADSAGWSTNWVESSRREAAVIAQIMAREDAGEIVVPEQEQPGFDAGATATEYLPGRIEL